jgi:hypothetical protein
MRQKKAATIGRNDPRRSGYVARPARARKTIGVALDKIANLIDNVRLGRKRLPIALKHL